MPWPGALSPLATERWGGVTFLQNQGGGEAQARPPAPADIGLDWCLDGPSRYREWGLSRYREDSAAMVADPRSPGRALSHLSSQSSGGALRSCKPGRRGGPNPASRSCGHWIRPVSGRSLPLQGVESFPLQGGLSCDGGCPPVPWPGALSPLATERWGGVTFLKNQGGGDALACSIG